VAVTAKPIRRLSTLEPSDKSKSTGTTMLPPFNPSQPSSGLLTLPIAPSSTHVIQKLSLSKLQPSPFQARKNRPERRIQEISTSLAKDGQLEPITVYPGKDENEGYYIVSGVTRYLAAQALKWETIDARVDQLLKDEDPLTILKASHLHNDTSPETDLDHAMVVNELTEKGYQQNDIALALGYKTTRDIRRLKTFHTLPQSILDLASANPERISSKFAEILRQAVDELGEEQATELTNELIEQNHSARQLQRRIAIEKRKKERDQGVQTRAKKETHMSVNFANAKVGHLTVFALPNNKETKRVQFLADLPVEVADRLAEQLEHLAGSLKDMSAEE